MEDRANDFELQESQIGMEDQNESLFQVDADFFDLSDPKKTTNVDPDKR